MIIHGRTREQGFKGSVNREGIRAVVEAVERMPVVGNGDIRTLADAAATFRETGCAAISIGRGALSNPFLFRQLAHWAEHGDPGPEPTLRRAGRPDGRATSTAWSSAGASGSPASSSARSSSGTATRSARPRSSTTA